MPPPAAGTPPPRLPPSQPAGPKHPRRGEVGKGGERRGDGTGRASLGPAARRRARTPRAAPRSPSSPLRLSPPPAASAAAGRGEDAGDARARSRARGQTLVSRADFQ